LQNPDGAKITGKILADLRYLPPCPKCASDSFTLDLQGNFNACLKIQVRVVQHHFCLITSHNWDSKQFHLLFCLSSNPLGSSDENMNNMAFTIGDFYNPVLVNWLLTQELNGRMGAIYTVLGEIRGHRRSGLLRSEI